MKKYIELEWKVIAIEQTDVITTSVEDLENVNDNDIGNDAFTSFGA